MSKVLGDDPFAPAEPAEDGQAEGKAQGTNTGPAAQGEAAQGKGKAAQGKGKGKGAQGKATHGEPTHGEPAQGKAAQGEPARGNASRPRSAKSGRKKPEPQVTFDERAAASPPPATVAPASTRGANDDASAGSGDAPAGRSVGREPGRPGDPRDDEAADYETHEDLHGASRDEGAADPDASTPPPDVLPPEEVIDEVFYGEEAAPTPGDYGPGLDTRREIPYNRRSITDEVRELERRVRARLTPAFPIERRRKVPLEFVWRRWRELAMRDRSDAVDAFGRDPVYADRVDPVLDFLYRRYFRVDAQGLENIPRRGRALLVANHSGTLPYDGAMVMYAVRKDSPTHREVRPLVEDFVFHFPYLGTIINRIGGVRACQENAERLLEEDQLVAVFPEGIKGVGKLYRERYRLQRFGRGGFIKLALRTGAPIIPTAIVGAEETHPMVARVTWLAKSIGVPYIPVTPTFPLLGPLGLLPLPTKWTIRFGEPIDLSSRHGPEAVDDRILVNKLGETVRSTIQEMVDETLAQRRSVFFG